MCDFRKIVFIDHPNDKFKLHFIQVKDMVNKPIREQHESEIGETQMTTVNNAYRQDDPVISCHHLVLKDLNSVTVCHHKSKHASLYWNCQLVDDTFDQFDKKYARDSLARE